MCGICGICNITNVNPVDPGIIRRMMDSIIHRGPDGSSLTISGRAAMGFNRLSFVDLVGGMQPLYNGDRSVFMICNGEIYNYRELKRGLSERGYVFRTETDVEVVPFLYDEYGLDFTAHLHGQFAIALYDSRTERLILVRDQMGVCPLFYTIYDGRIIFGSEIKAIMDYPGIQRKLNLRALDQLMNFPGAVSPETFFKGIFSVKPGHMLCFDDENGMRDIEYWDIQYEKEISDKGEKYYLETLKELLKKSISMRLDADVPIGFYLSGGLDSSIVAGFIRKYNMNSCRSFSAEIDSAGLDESIYQKLVRESVGSKHLSVSVSDELIYESLREVVYHAESALKESYDAAAFLLSGLVAQTPAKAVLTGQGSDEIFCGYVGYMLDSFRNMRKASMSEEEKQCNLRLWGKEYFRYERDHPAIRSVHRKLYSPDLRNVMEDFSALREGPVDTEKLKGLSDPQRRSYIDCKLRLSDHLLIEHGDHMSFAHSVEGRHPFIDTELIEFVCSMPDEYKINGTDEKYILKKAGRDIVPDEIIKRKKFPFQSQGMSSLAKSTGIISLISDSKIKEQGIFDCGYVSQLVRMYTDPDFKLMGAYDIDYLMIVVTTTLLCDIYSLSI